METADAALVRPHPAPARRSGDGAADARRGRPRAPAGAAHGAARPAGVVARARRLFDLDADPIAVDEALARHPELAPLVAAVPGIRVPGAADPHEMLIRAMVGQQISVAAARTHLTQLADALGDAARPPAERGRGLRAALTGSSPRWRRSPSAGTRCCAGRPPASAPSPAPQRRSPSGEPDARPPATTGPSSARRCSRCPASGRGRPTTCACACTGDPDVFLPGDVAVRAGAARVGIPSDAAGLTAWAARVAPWRSYLTAHLWRAIRTDPSQGDPMTTGLIQTIDTPDGAFTIVADAEGRVLASGWTDDEGRRSRRIPASLRPDRLTAATLTAGDAAALVLRGRPRRHRPGRGAQAGTEMQLAGWRALRRIDAGRAAQLHRASPRRSGRRARCGPRHPSARATRRRSSCRATGCCAATGRSAASPGAST